MAARFALTDRPRRVWIRALTEGEFMAKKIAKKKAASKQKSKKPAAKKSAPKAAAQPKWKPEGLHDVIANLVLKNAAGAIEFYKSAFGAKETMRMMSPDGRAVWHAELSIGDSTIFLNDDMPGGGGPSFTAPPGPDHKASFTIQLYVPDCDHVFNRAVQAGARPGMPLMDMFWGDRMGSVVDPFGQPWMISTRVKQLTQEQMRKGGEEFAKQMAQQAGMQPPSAPKPPSQPPPASSAG
jgi:PhnB protein